MLVLSPPEGDPHWVVLVGGSPPSGVSLSLADALPLPWSDGAACLNGPGLLDEPLEESGTVAVLQAGFPISDQSGWGMMSCQTQKILFGPDQWVLSL